MTIRLRPVSTEEDIGILFDLLKERTPEQSISHRVLPTWDEHCAFVRSNPYFRWYMILHGHVVAASQVWYSVGSIYLSQRREIGIGLLRAHQRRGYGREAVQMLMRLHPGAFLANVNPANTGSHAFWERMGFKLIQVTYAPG